MSVTRRYIGMYLALIKIRGNYLLGRQAKSLLLLREMMWQKFQNINQRVSPAPLFSTRECAACGQHQTSFIPLFLKSLLVLSVGVDQTTRPHELEYWTALKLKGQIFLAVVNSDSISIVPLKAGLVGKTLLII